MGKFANCQEKQKSINLSAMELVQSWIIKPP